MVLSDSSHWEYNLKSEYTLGMRLYVWGNAWLWYDFVKINNEFTSCSNIGTVS